MCIDSRKALIGISWMNLKDVKKWAMHLREQSRQRGHQVQRVSEAQVYLVFLKTGYEGRVPGAEWEENSKTWDRRSISLPLLRTLVFTLTGNGEPRDSFEQVNDTIWLVLKIIILATLGRRDYGAQGCKSIFRGYSFNLGKRWYNRGSEEEANSRGQKKWWALDILWRQGLPDLLMDWTWERKKRIKDDSMVLDLSNNWSIALLFTKLGKTEGEANWERRSRTQFWICWVWAGFLFVNEVSQ